MGKGRTLWALDELTLKIMRDAEPVTRQSMRKIRWKSKGVEGEKNKSEVRGEDIQSRDYERCGLCDGCCIIADVFVHPCMRIYEFLLADGDPFFRLRCGPILALD